jgi:hypothetical protein
MRTEDLIVALARAGAPVRPLERPLIRLARWTAATAPLMALAVVVIGPRRDLGTAMSEPAFAGIAVVTFGTALLSAASAFILSIPGAERSAWQRSLPLFAAGVWGLILSYSLATEGSALQRLLAWPIMLATLAAVALAAVATQLICPIDDPAHQLVGHLMPVAILSVLGALAGPRYLNWLNP